MDQITIDRIKLMHPALRDKALADYTAANSVLGKEVRLRFSYTLRTFAEQDALFAKRPKVTNAKAGQSFHNYGLAFDIVLMYDKNGDGVFEEVSWDMARDGDGDKVADWLEVTKVLTGAGWTNGFFSNGKKWDFPHFQIDYGLKWQTLLQRYNAKDFVEGTYVRLF
jgi:peptidoglycan L-alanyl-D-glutamate endopeptidase CwlK